MSACTGIILATVINWLTKGVYSQTLASCTMVRWKLTSRNWRLVAWTEIEPRYWLVLFNTILRKRGLAMLEDEWLPGMRNCVRMKVGTIYGIGVFGYAQTISDLQCINISLCNSVLYDRSRINRTVSHSNVTNLGQSTWACNKWNKKNSNYAIRRFSLGADCTALFIYSNVYSKELSVKCPPNKKSREICSFSKSCIAQLFYCIYARTVELSFPPSQSPMVIHLLDLTIPSMLYWWTIFFLQTASIRSSSPSGKNRGEKSRRV